MVLDLDDAETATFEHICLVGILGKSLLVAPIFAWPNPACLPGLRSHLLQEAVFKVPEAEGGDSPICPPATGHTPVIELITLNSASYVATIRLPDSGSN